MKRPDENEYLASEYKFLADQADQAAIIEGQLSPRPSNVNHRENQATRGVLRKLCDWLLGRGVDWGTRVGEAKVRRIEAETRLKEAVGFKVFAEGKKAFEEAEAVKRESLMKEAEKEIEHRERLNQVEIRRIAIARYRSMKDAEAAVENTIENLELKGGAFEASEEPLPPLPAAEEESRDEFVD
jgi:hypothetical protein